MEKYVCRSCWYTYDPVAGDPKGGVAPGTPFEEVSEEWFCPICMMGKENFLPLTEVEKEAKEAKIEPENKDLSRYQCKACWYVYDPRVGDEKAGIAPGTPFAELPEDWFCPVCMLTKDQFVQIKMTDPLAEEKKEAPPEKAKDVKRYHCKACWYTYDPRVGDEKAGIPPDTPFEDLPEDWFCPICMMGKNYFEAE